jgi:hypothetical protein
MNELKRLEYLKAMGVHTYVSRHRLPGAAITRRLAVVRDGPAPPRGNPDMPATQSVKAAPVPDISDPGFDVVPSVQKVVPRSMPGATESTPRFSLAVIACGGWLWLEELESEPYEPTQLQLVQAISAALLRCLVGSTGELRPISTQFDWPLHNNRQLDMGEEAARTSVAAFVQRKLDQPDCRGLVLLGKNAQSRVPLGRLDCPSLACTASTRQMLQLPQLKQQVWQDLQGLILST